MKPIKSRKEILSLENNVFIGELPELIDSEILFYGKNNILFCEEGVILKDSIITFGGNNSIIFLRKSKHNYKVIIKVFNDSTIYFDENNYFNEQINILVSEAKNLLIGKDCMFSHDVTIMTSDHHIIYDINSHERINNSKSIYIGDHVWIGQKATILKGTKIDSGSIIGASTVISRKEIENNSIYAGNPSRKIKSNVFWDGTNSHKWNQEMTKRKMINNDYQFIYDYENFNSLSFDEIDEFLQANNNKERLRCLILLSNYNEKNRFVHKKILEEEKNIEKIFKKSL